MDNLDGNCRRKNNTSYVILLADIFVILEELLSCFIFLKRDLLFETVYSSSKQPDLLPRSVAFESPRDDDEECDDRYFMCAAQGSKRCVQQVQEFRKELKIVGSFYSQ